MKINPSLNLVWLNSHFIYCLMCLCTVECPLTLKLFIYASIFVIIDYDGWLDKYDPFL